MKDCKILCHFVRFYEKNIILIKLGRKQHHNDRIWCEKRKKDFDILIYE